MDNNTTIATPIYKTVGNICRSPIAIVSAALILVCSLAFDFFTKSLSITTALLILNLVAVCVSSGVKKLLFKPGVSIASFVVFTVCFVVEFLNALFPESDFVIFSFKNFKVALLPEQDFLGVQTVQSSCFLLIIALHFLCKIISEASLQQAIKKNMPFRKSHVTCGILHIILTIVCIGITLIFVYNNILTNGIVLEALPFVLTTYPPFVIEAIFLFLAIAMLIEAIKDFANFSKIRKTEYAFL